MAHSGLMPVGKGEPAMGCRAPVVDSTVRADMLLEPEFATKAYLPVGSRAIASGMIPTVNGDPAISLNAPEIASSV